MSHATDISTLVRWLAADFSNQPQAFENPPLYAHIRVCMRPLSLDVFGEPCLFLEQAYDFMLSQPYRLRVFKFKIVNDRIELENFKVRDEQEYFGAARDRDRLNALTPDRLEWMDGCDMIVDWMGESFKGKIKPGRNCIVYRKDRRSYLDSQFEIFPHRMTSLDRGYCPETNEMLWGSIAGPFEFERRTSYADEVSF